MKIFFVFFLIVAIITGLILSLTVLFPIKHISAKGSRVYTSQQIIDECGVEIGDNIFTVSKTESLKRLKNKLPYVEKVEFNRSLPDELIIKVTDAKEYACYKVDKKYYTVSKDGWVLNSYKKKPKNVVVIVCDVAKCEVGNSIEFNEGVSHDDIQNLIEQLTNYKFEINSIDVSDIVELKVKIDNRFIVNFGTAVDLEFKIRHLNSMTKEMDKNATGKIDLSMWNSQNTQGTFVQTAIK